MDVETLNGQIVNAWPSTAAHIVPGLALTLGLLIHSVILGSRWRQVGVLRAWRWGDPIWHTKSSLALMFWSNLAFAFIAALLTNGIGLSIPEACSAGVWTCVFAYCLTKVFIYSFYLERAYIVIAPYRQSRFKSPAYNLNLLLFIGAIGAVITLCVKRTAYIDDNQMCRIGVTHVSTIYVIVWDCLTSLCLTLTFATSIWRTAKSDKLRRIAIRSCCGAIASLCATVANMTALVILKEELGAICLSACLLDVTVNAIALSLLTSNTTDEEDRSRLSPPSSSIESKRQSTALRADGLSLQQALMVDLSAALYTLRRTPTTDIESAPNDALFVLAK